MIVGIDTYHDSTQKGRSCAALVSSMNSNFTRYYSHAAYQTAHTELHSNLATSITGTALVASRALRPVMVDARAPVDGGVYRRQQVLPPHVTVPATGQKSLCRTAVTLNLWSDWLSSAMFVGHRYCETLSVGVVCWTVLSVCTASLHSMHYTCLHSMVLAQYKGEGIWRVGWVLCSDVSGCVLCRRRSLLPLFPTGIEVCVSSSCL